MSKKESWFWGKIRDNLKLDFMKRVENKVEPGWPDVHYLHKALSGWIELKYEAKFPRKIDFEPGQPIWLDNYFRNGGCCYVWLYVEKDNTIYIWLGCHAKELNELGGTEKVKPFAQVQMNARGWLELYQLLFSTENSNVELLTYQNNP